MDLNNHICSIEEFETKLNFGKNHDRAL